MERDRRQFISQSAFVSETIQHDDNEEPVRAAMQQVVNIVSISSLLVINRRMSDI